MLGKNLTNRVKVQRKKEKLSTQGRLCRELSWTVGKIHPAAIRIMQIE